MQKRVTVSILIGESKIINNENLWVGNFSGEKITKDSVIIYSGMMNKDKNIFEHGWVVYPNIYTALGFIQNVFLYQQLLLHGIRMMLMDY